MHQLCQDRHFHFSRVLNQWRLETFSLRNMSLDGQARKFYRLVQCELDADLAVFFDGAVHLCMLTGTESATRHHWLSSSAHQQQTWDCLQGAPAMVARIGYGSSHKNSFRLDLNSIAIFATLTWFCEAQQPWRQHRTKSKAAQCLLFAPQCFVPESRSLFCFVCENTAKEYNQVCT